MSLTQYFKHCTKCGMIDVKIINITNIFQPRLQIKCHCIGDSWTIPYFSSKRSFNSASILDDIVKWNTIFYDY